MRRVSHRPLLSAALRRLAGAVCVLACASLPVRAELESVTVQLKWEHQFQFAGFYAAQAKGFYRDAGLEVTLRELPRGAQSHGIDPVRLVLGLPIAPPPPAAVDTAAASADLLHELSQAQPAEYGVSDSRLLIHRARGHRVVVLASLFQHSPAVLAVRADAEGRAALGEGGRIMLTSGPSDGGAPELLVLMARSGGALAKAERIPHTYRARDLQEGKTDGMAGYITDLPYRLQQEGVRHLTISPRSVGLDAYGDVLFTSEDELRKHPARAAALRAATLRGWAYAMQHPEEIVDLIRERYPHRLPRAQLMEEARAMIPLLGTIEAGHSNPERWRAIADIYAAHRLLPSSEAATKGLLYQPQEASAGASAQAQWLSGAALAGGLLLGALLMGVAMRAHQRAGLAKSEADLAELKGRLELAEQRWQDVLQHAADGAWEWYRDSGEIRLTPGYKALLGYGPDEFEVNFNSWLLHVHPDDIATLMAELRSVLQPLATQPDGGLATEFRLRRKDGSWIWVLARGVVLERDEQGRPRHLGGTTTDISARRLAEEERIQAMLEAAPEAMLVLDEEGKIQYANQRAAQDFGYPHAALAGTAVTHLAPGLREGARAVSVQSAVRRDGSQFPAEVSCTAMQAAGRQLTVVALRNVAERQQAELALKALAARQREILDMLPIGLYIRVGARVQLMNRACEALLGMALEQLHAADGDGTGRLRSALPQEALRLLDSPLPPMPADGGAAMDDKVVAVSDPALGRVRHLRSLRKHVVTEQAEGDYLIGMLVDITDSIHTEQQLRELNEHLEDRVEQRTRQLELARKVAEQASQAKGQFLAHMSHELRTPLNGVVGMAHLVLKTDLDARQRDYIEKIRFAGEHLVGIIDNILDFSKIEAGRLEIEHIGFTLENVLQTVTAVVAPNVAGKPVELVLEVAPGLPPALQGDPLRLGQILINYTNNAIKFSERGRITVRVALAEDGPGDCLVRFEVQDQGMGVAPHQAALLFQSFRQADNSISRAYGGTGLGLAICRQLATLMGGEVGVDSVPGQGSCFWFTARLGKLERLPEPGCDGIELNPALAARLQGAHVLLVEDNSFNQQIGVELLEQAGCRVTLAANGAEALELLAHEQFACVLMDVQMPVLDGLQTTRALRADPRHANLPVLAMTATATSADRARCLAVGMNDFLSKPMAPALLYATIARWLPPGDGTAGPVAESAPAISMPGGDPQVIDLSMLAKLLSYHPAKIRKFATKFLQSAESSLDEVEAALEADDLARVRELGHRLKSSARTVGALGMADLCLALEQLPPGPPEQERNTARVLLSRLRSLLAQVTDHVMRNTSFANDA